MFLEYGKYTYILHFDSALKLNTDFNTIHAITERLQNPDFRNSVLPLLQRILGNHHRYGPG